MVRRNSGKKIAGQIVNSANNIYDLVKRVMILKSIKLNPKDYTVSLHESQVAFAADNMKYIFDQGTECITDLV